MFDLLVTYLHAKLLQRHEPWCTAHTEATLAWLICFTFLYSHSPNMPYFLNITSDVSQKWYHTIILYHTWSFNLTHTRSLPASLSEPLLTSWVSSICGLQLHYGVTNWQLLGSAGSHPALIVFKLCCCTNKHMGACRTMSRTPTRLQSHYTLSGVQVEPTHHSSLRIFKAKIISAEAGYDVHFLIYFYLKKKNISL